MHYISVQKTFYLWGLLSRFSNYWITETHLYSIIKLYTFINIYNHIQYDL